MFLTGAILSQSILWCLVAAQDAGGAVANENWVASDAHSEQQAPFQKQALSASTAPSTESNILFGLAIIGVLLLLVVAFGVGVYVGMVIRRGSPVLVGAAHQGASASQQRNSPRTEMSRAAPAYRQPLSTGLAHVSAASTLPATPLPPPTVQQYQHRQSSAATVVLQQFSVSSGGQQQQQQQAPRQQNDILSSMRVNGPGRRSPKTND